MSRDGSGTYTLPVNSFAEPVASTVISPTDAAATLNDFATELTDSLSRSGKGGMSADLDMSNNDINNTKTVVMKGSTSGNTTVMATAIAGTTTLTLPAATDTLTGKATTDTLTNKTFDTAGTGNVFKINGTAISANTGTGSNVLATSPTITTPNVVGTSTNDSAAAGGVGEYISASVASGSAVALTTATAKTITSISLTAGDWDVSGEVLFTGGATTTVTDIIGSISTTADTLDSTVGRRVQHWYNGGAVFNVLDPTLTCPMTRQSLAGTTTVYLIGRADFGTSTASGYGVIRARRVR